MLSTKLTGSDLLHSIPPAQPLTLMMINSPMTHDRLWFYVTVTSTNQVFGYIISQCHGDITGPSTTIAQYIICMLKVSTHIIAIANAINLLMQNHHDLW